MKCGELKQRGECNNDGDPRPLERQSLSPSPATRPGGAVERQIPVRAPFSVNVAKMDALVGRVENNVVTPVRERG